MSDKLDNAVADVLTHSSAVMGSMADKFVELAKQYGPDVLNGAMNAARVDAANKLFAPAIVFTANLVIGYKIIPIVWKWYKDCKAEVVNRYDDAAGQAVCAGLVTAASS